MIDRRERYELLDKDHKVSERKQCELLGIGRGKLFYKPKPETSFNLKLMKIIDKQYGRTPFYGVPRMTVYLNTNHDVRVNKKRIERLYKLMAIKAIGPIPNTTIPSGERGKFPYLLRGVKAVKPNHVWAADITYIGLRRGFMYLFAIIDLYSRMIVNWNVSNSMTAEWCTSTIREALLLNEKPEIFNTDQGSQFTSEIYVSLLQSEQIRISMDGKGRAIDNIFIERFWRSVKQEYVYINPPNGGRELYDGIEEYMRYYNHERPHQSLDYKTPAEIYYGRKINFKCTKYSTTVV